MTRTCPAERFLEDENGKFGPKGVGRAQGEDFPPPKKEADN